MTLPESVQRYLVQQFLDGRRSAYLFADGRGVVVERGGALQGFGLEMVEVGAAIADRLSIFQGLIPNPQMRPDCLPRIEMPEGRSTDIYYGPAFSGSYVVFLDATEEAEREQRFQQRGNELALTLRALGWMVFERLTATRFVPLGPATSWFRALCGRVDGSVDLVEHFPFLDPFLVDAEAVWQEGGGRTLWSGIWIEQAAGREWSLEANATRLDDGRKLLVIQSIERRYKERQKILQQARSRSLDLERLRKEIDKKETLLHCIVHDLKGPLSAMVGSMSLVQSPELDSGRARQLLELGLEQARKQESMIQTILETFSAEMKSLQEFETVAEHAPDLLTCLRQSLDTFTPACVRRRISLDLNVDPLLPKVCKVVGVRSRLERVIANILENALRFSPDGGVVAVRVAPGEGEFRVTVEDEGPGVEREVEDALFQRFGGSSRSGGVAGLGLYFCRTTLELWGGRIAYEARSEGGSRFWFALPRARPAGG